MLKRVGIIGAGISGLTSGYALREQGLEVDLYERSGSINEFGAGITLSKNCLLYTSPSPRDGLLSRMPSSA